MSDEIHELSEDSIRIMMDTQDEIHNGEYLTCYPRLQILSIQDFSEGESIPRHRVVLSDGLFMAHGILPSDMNQRIFSGSIYVDCIIKVNVYSVHLAYNIGTTFIIILDLDVIGERSEIIGCPLPLYWYRLPAFQDEDNSGEITLLEQ